MKRHLKNSVFFIANITSLSSSPHPMTGYTVHTGSSEKFSQGWDQIFKSQTKAKAAKSAGQTSSKKSGDAQPAKSPRKSK